MRVGCIILLDKGIIHHAYYFTGLHRHHHLSLDMLVASIYEKLQAIVVFAKIRQQDALRLTVGTFHVINIKLSKIAGNNPPRSLRIGQHSRITLSLLKRCEQRAVALPDGLAQVFAKRLLLYHDMSGWYHYIDERRIVKLNLIFKLNKLSGMLHAIHTTQQVEPEALALSLLVALILPSLCEILGC